MLTISLARWVPLLIIAALLGGSLGCGVEGEGDDISGIPGNPASGPLRVTAPNSRYFFRDGYPILFAGPGGPEDLLFHGARAADGISSGGDQRAVIGRLTANGGDALYVQAVKSHGGDGILANGSFPACPRGTSCYWRANPFRYGDPRYAADPPILTQWYSWLSSADSAGIVTHFFFYDDSSCPWYGPATGDRIADRTQCRRQTGLIPEEDARLITPVVNRLKGLKNIVWVVAEEYSEAITISRASAIATRIRALDPDHPVAVHQLAGTTFRFAGNPNVEAFEMQLGPAVNTADLVHASVAEAYDLAQGRYAVVLAESAWQLILVAAGDRASLRKSNWAAVMAGAAGVLDYGMWEPTVPDSATLGDLKRLKLFFEGTNWTGMSSGDSYLSSATNYARYGPSGDFILYSAGCSPNALLGYSNVPAEADYTISWFDAIDGSTSTETQHLTAGANQLTVPAHLSGECGVWVARS